MPRLGKTKYVPLLRFLLLKDPHTQMACNAPKNWAHFGFHKQLIWPLLLYLYCAQRHRGTLCLGTVTDLEETSRRGTVKE